MSDSPTIEPLQGAVFLSYASQDMGAASRICNSLSEAGIEVWFDQSELKSGDVWETTILERINSCRLFIPLISANSNARSEGYFRREWNLAVDRTHGMHESRPFLIPIVIDGTSDAEALVPERFRRTHWSRFIGGEITPTFCRRVASLLGGTPEGSENSQIRPRKRLAPGADPQAPKSRKTKWIWTGVAAAAVGAIVCAIFWPRDLQPPSMSVAASGAVVAPIAADISPKSIAVLPFENMSDNKENAYFADGIQEDILTSLALIGDLNVISRTSVMRYRDTIKSTQQIGKELGVAYVLEGSVRRSGNTVRVTGQLIDARTGLHAWANSYNRNLDDIFAIQESLAREIAGALHSVLTPTELARLARKPTENTEAYDLFLKGKAAYYNDDSSQTKVARARPLFERSVTLDPKFYQAWLELYTVYSTYWEYSASAEFHAKADDALDTAARLAPDAPDVMIQLYLRYSESNDTAKMDEIQRRLTEAFPNNSLSLWVQADAARSLRGDMGLASKIYQRAVALDPQNVGLLDQAGAFYMDTRHYDLSEVMFAAEGAAAPLPPWNSFRNSLIPFLARGEAGQTEAYLASLSPDALRNDESAISAQAEWDYHIGDAQGLIKLWEESGRHWSFAPWTTEHDVSVVAQAFISLGKPDRARPLLEKDRDRIMDQLGKDPDDGQRWENLAQIYALLADEPSANEAHRKMLMCPVKHRSDRWNEHDWLLAASWLGKKEYKDRAIAEFARALGEKQPFTFASNVFLSAHSIGMWPLQGDPRFEALLKDPANNAPTF
jgi:TolB-like protein/Tfp pilus assembly protein PilF